MRQALGPGALGRPRGIGWSGRWEGGSGWGTHVNPWLIHFSVWQNPLQYCKVISLQLIKKKKKGKKKTGQSIAGLQQGIWKVDTLPRLGPLEGRCERDPRKGKSLHSCRSKCQLRSGSREHLQRAADRQIQGPEGGKGWNWNWGQESLCR